MRWLLILSVCVLASGCKSADAPLLSNLPRVKLPKLGIPHVHKISIQQGNVLSREMIDKLRPGMTKRQVLYVLGRPVIANTFRDDAWEYVYTYKAPDQPMTVDRLTLYFDGDVLKSFSGDIKPSNWESRAMSGDASS